MLIFLKQTGILVRWTEPWQYYWHTRGWL